MDIVLVFIAAFFLFIIIFVAVRLAISPLLYKSEEFEIDKQDFGLAHLRDMEILSNMELEEVITIFQNRSVHKGDNEQYQKYIKVLKELKEIGYFTDETYSNKIERLNKYFEVD